MEQSRVYVVTQDFNEFNAGDIVVCHNGEFYYIDHPGYAGTICVQHSEFSLYSLEWFTYWVPKSILEFLGEL